MNLCFCTIMQYDDETLDQVKVLKWLKYKGLENGHNKEIS